MNSVLIRDAADGDHETVCALNLDVVEHTSAMNAARLSTLANLASYFKVACAGDRVVAFLLAMRSGAFYENDNYSWFERRFTRFIYVDRVVVSPEFRGRHLGSLLYEDLFRYARESLIPFVACEYNIDPPNEASRSFHDGFGFREQGTQWVANGSKRVSLQVAVT